MTKDVSINTVQSNINNNIDLNSIPSLPTAAMKIMTLIFDSEVDIDELINTIKQDISLCSEVLKVANSASYQTSEPVNNLNQAVVNLGLDQIKKIVLSISVIGSMEELLSKEGFNIILTHSLATAAAAQILADKSVQANSDTAFLIGLFLDLGLFVCANLYPDDFDMYYQESQDKGIHLRTIIEDKLSIKINQLSLELANKWGLPASIVENLNCQSLIEKKLVEPSIEIDILSVISYLSTMAADVYFGASAVVSIEKFKEHLKILMDLDSEQAADVLMKLSVKFNEVSGALNLNLQNQPDFSEVLKKANQELLKINDKHEEMYRELTEKNKQLATLSNNLDKKNKLLNKLVTTDPLTSLYNRRYFVTNLDRIFAQAVRSKQELSIVMLDIDFFKLVNDDYGHQAGDEVLIKTSQQIQKHFRKTDICARYGGEEFIIILPDTSLDGAIKTAEQVRLAIEENTIPLKMLSPTINIKITASFGVATINADIKSPDQLIQVSDKFLYLSKDDGRNCVRPKSF